MKKIFFAAGWIVLFCAQMVLAQERIEAPVWNVGDKWVFTNEVAMEVADAGGNNYVVKFPKSRVTFDKSTLNRTFTVYGGNREPYKEDQRRLLNFPLAIGKGWKDSYSTELKWDQAYQGRIAGSTLGTETKIFETYKALGWEEIEVQGGRFKAVRLEYRREWSSPTTGMREGMIRYWYSPEVKNLIKCQYDKSQMWSKESDWELVSFHLAK